MGAEDDWSKEDFHNFFFSSGFILPKRKKSKKRKITPAMLAEYYQELGLPRGSKAQAVRRAYRQLALKYHPDKNSNSQEATRRFQAITEAYAAVCAQLESGEALATSPPWT